MAINFDEIIDRHGTYSTQWDYIEDRFGRADILPFSISDTDFSVPTGVQDAIKRRIEHPIYGYTRWNHEEYKESVCNWFEKQDNVKISKNWISYSPSVIFSVSVFIRIKSEPGDSVAVFTPMYDAFYGVIKENNRFLVPIRLGNAYSDYNVDWDSLEAVLKQKQTKILLLTNPHNPTGKVFSKEELKLISELCEKYEVFIISDDIHRDVVFDQYKYVPLTEVRKKDMVLCSSASKTFNIPGLIGSYLIQPDEQLYAAFQIELKQKNALSSVSILGMLAQVVNADVKM
ncbi:aminotransferase class I/II-fold pyridoxal phosphate-dependent enzyme [Liquorilactobacillus satsumensis]|nr:aminotransferase class I/II-fold pyridoxal phosphate-dependent enzyme [Liquorilactobacillus satsumensis]MCP9371986.1 aminotransferase class I/II-fold pyridoxal phosphate-dependent enzyme [Liquorilactobacillus satsumensis]